MDAAVAILIVILVILAGIALWRWGPGAAAGVAAVLGGGRRRPKKNQQEFPHMYNPVWDDQSVFRLVEPGTPGRPLIIVPYRGNPLQNRAEHLAIYLRLIRGHLPNVPVLVAEQSDDGQKFNRGAVFNAAIAAFEKGEVPALADYKPTHYVLSDVDLLPSKALIPHYTAIPANGPVHLGVRNRLYEMSRMCSFFGGVAALTPEQYRKSGGFPNRFWGWGGEDVAFRMRLQAAGFKLFRPKTGYVANIPHAWGDSAGHAKDPESNSKMREEKAEPLKWAAADGIAQVEYEVVNLADQAAAYDPAIPTPPAMVRATFKLSGAPP